MYCVVTICAKTDHFELIKFILNEKYIYLYKKKGIGVLRRV